MKRRIFLLHEGEKLTVMDERAYDSEDRLVDGVWWAPESTAGSFVPKVVTNLAAILQQEGFEHVESL
jgi:hypothetical protein